MRLIKNNFALGISFILLCSYSITSKAEIDWVSVTLDNDAFVGTDNGYTNGLYLSFFDVGDAASQIPSHDFWVSPLMWSMPEDDVLGAVNSYMVGQTMNTPSDITIVNPDSNELPYSALLAFTNSYVTINSSHADRVSTTIGVVGPAALGEEVQKFWHDLIGADEPLGWDTQLKNEIVFNFSRGRTWRSWVSDSGNFDLLTNANASFGTIQSIVGTGLTFRYGRNLLSSYATTLFNSSRTSNPTAISNGWYFYSGFQAGYIFNQIFTDGNTFENSRSIEYDHEYVGLSAGFAYSNENFSFTYAINDSNVIQDGSREETLENLTQFGTITLAWKL